MRNNHPKSEGPALKERAAEAKNKKGLQDSIEHEKASHQHVPSGPIGAPTKDAKSPSKKGP